MVPFHSWNMSESDLNLQVAHYPGTFLSYFMFKICHSGEGTDLGNKFRGKLSTCSGQGDSGSPYPRPHSSTLH